MRIISAVVSIGLALTTGAIAADKVQVGEGKVFPESFSAGADGTLYAGSISFGQIFRAAPGAGSAAMFIDKPADGPTAIIGVYADNKSGLLWACYADLAWFAGTPGQPSIARSYDLASGALKGSYPLSGASFCNDMTAAPDGTLYVADTVGGRIMRLKPGAAALEDWLVDAKNFPGIDGITLSADGMLYVNSVTANTLMSVAINADGSPGAVTPLTLSAPVKGPDGMRFGSDGVLYLAENGAGQADSITLSGSNATIKPLITGLGAPTAVELAPDGQLWVLEAKIDKMADPNEAGPFYIIPVAK